MRYKYKKKKIISPIFIKGNIIFATDNSYMNCLMHRGGRPGEACCLFLYPKIHEISP